MKPFLKPRTSSSRSRRTRASSRASASATAVRPSMSAARPRRAPTPQGASASRRNGRWARGRRCCTGARTRSDRSSASSSTISARVGGTETPSSPSSTASSQVRGESFEFGVADGFAFWEMMVTRLTFGIVYDYGCSDDVSKNSTCRLRQSNPSACRRLD